MYQLKSVPSLLFFVILTISSLVFAGGGEPISSEESRKRLSTFLENTKAFRSNYQQVLEDKNRKVLESARGSFALGENGAFRNEISSPDKTSIVSDGQKLWIIDYELEQVIISTLSSYLGDSPLLMLLQSPQETLKAFHVQDKKSDASGARLYFLEPVDTQDKVQAVRMGTKQGRITYIEFDERMGNRARIDFLTYEAPQDSGFEVSIPKDFDVIDETL